MDRRASWCDDPGRVLVVHHYYQLRGGEDIGFEVEVEAMRSIGWNVDTLFVENAHLGDNVGAKGAVNAIWSKSSAKLVHDAVQEYKPEIVHVHNFVPILSPSIHWAARRSGTAVVQTLHNFRLGCLSGSFFRDGDSCSDCLGKSPILGVQRRCYRNSLGASSVLFTMIELHRALGTWDKAVDAFIALTPSSRDLLVRMGIKEALIHVKPGMLYPDLGVGVGSGGYCLFVGRLTEEKGIQTLLNAWKRHEYLPTLIIVGNGPLESVVRNAAADDHRIQMVGHKSKRDVIGYMKGARVLIFPSEWFENCPMVVVESIAAGTPVVASDLGSVRDLLGRGAHSIFFEPGNSASLAHSVASYLDSDAQYNLSRISARARYEQQFSSSSNLERLGEIYDSAILRSNAIHS